MNNTNFDNFSEFGSGAIPSLLRSPERRVVGIELTGFPARPGKMPRKEGFLALQSPPSPGRHHSCRKDFHWMEYVRNDKGASVD